MGNPTIEYNNIKVNFDRKFNIINISENESISKTIAMSGVDENLNFFNRDTIRIVRNRIKAELIDQLERWYQYVKSGNSFKLWIDRDLGFYLGFEGKSLKANDIDDGNFSRTGIAKYIDPWTGQVEQVAENVARFPEGKFGSGIVIEAASTNILVRSEEFDNASWLKTNVTVTANTTETLDPEGGNTAEKIVSTAAFGSISQATSTQILTNDAVFSIWLKALSPQSNNVQLIIADDLGNTLSARLITVTNEWYRYNVYYNNTVSDSDNWKVFVFHNFNNDTIYYWGAQLEVGANRLYPTGYIETVAASATRNNETLYYNLTNDLNIGYLKGTVSFWINPPWDSNDGANRRLIDISDSSGATFISIFRNTSNQVEVQIGLADGSGWIQNINTPAGVLTQNDWNLIVVTYDLTISRVVIYINGIQKVSNDASSGIPKIPNKLYIGSTDTPSEFADTKFDDIFIYKDVKTLEWVQEIYRINRALGIKRNYWPSLMLSEYIFNPVLQQGGNYYDFELIAEEILT